MYSIRHRRPHPGLASESDGDSEADVEVRRPRAPPPRLDKTSSAAPPGPEQKKKKKKKPLPPQKSIDKVWERFSQKRFTKAIAVLPFAPVAPSPLSEGANNELLRQGFERAADECRRKVQKIIQECRRVNMRYRDPGWDIEWDLSTGRGNCLNRLGHVRFDVTTADTLNSRTGVPKAVKRVHEIFEKPTFLQSISGNDIKQGCLGDCWFISCASGLASVPEAIKRICVAYDTKIGIYGFVFYRDGEWIYSIIDDKLYLTSPSWDSHSYQRSLLQQIDSEDAEPVYRKTYQTGSKALFFAQNKDQNETWLPLMEKAYAKAHGDYDSLNGGWIGEGIEDLTGGVTSELFVSDIFDTDRFWDNEICRVNDEFLFGCSTGLLHGGTGDRDGITEGHAYNIMEARTLKNGTRLLKIRNPWGKLKSGNWKGAWSDGSREWTPEVQQELGHTFGNDSVFWISYEDFLVKFQQIDRTRLFCEPGWHCCQRWIAVDVPWRATYSEKFQFTLTEESPVVLVLSQLDTRYFEGLSGQYTFRMHFRLHKQDRPGAEDYIVRSLNNYFMNRSVSVDLPLLEAGHYSVFLSVEADRENYLPTVEAVLKRELAMRGENEKLVQVGQAYDLAHSKASAYMQELASVRKKSDQVKASQVRKKGLRKAWEKRHLLEDIRRRQQAKNDEKKKKCKEEAELKKKEEAAAEEKKKEESQAEDKSGEPQTPVAVEAASASTSGNNTPVQTPLDTPRSQPAAASNEDISILENETAPLAADSTETIVPATEENSESKRDAETQVDMPDKEDKVPDGGGTSKEEQLAPSSQASSSASAQQSEESDNSSDSPVEDWEEWYSSDDLRTKASRKGLLPPTVLDSSEDEDSEEETGPEPWNAICIVGIRAYSKDDKLELRVVMEGGNVSASGRGGEQGEPDLDNAQANAGGQRVKEKADKDDKTEQKQANGKGEKS